MPYSTKDPLRYPPEFEVFLTGMSRGGQQKIVLQLAEDESLNGRRVQLQSFFKAAANYAEHLQDKLVIAQRKKDSTAWLEREIEKWKPLALTARRLVVRMEQEARQLVIEFRTSGIFGEQLLAAIGGAAAVMRPDRNVQLEALQDLGAEWFWSGKGLEMYWDDPAKRQALLVNWLREERPDMTAEEVGRQVKIITSLAIMKERRANGQSLMDLGLTGESGEGIVDPSVTQTER